MDFGANGIETPEAALARAGKGLCDQIAQELAEDSPEFAAITFDRKIAHV